MNMQSYNPTAAPPLGPPCEHCGTPKRISVGESSARGRVNIIWICKSCPSQESESSEVPRQG